MRINATGGEDDGRMPSERLLPLLDKVRSAGDGQWMACCPAHDDRNPSLSIKEGDGGTLLLHCFAGCDVPSIVQAVGLELSDLFPADREYTTTSYTPKYTAHIEGARIVLELARADVAAQRDISDEDWDGVETAWRTLEQAGIDPGETIIRPHPWPPSAAEFAAIEFPPIRPILGPFASQQIALLYAPSGVGKTMFGLALAHAMATGRDFAHWRSHRRVRVLYVDAEMSAHMMQKRLHGAPDEWLFIANLTGWGSEMEPLNLATREGQAQVSQWCDQLQIDVVILDNFINLAWKEGVSLNSDESWTPVRRWATHQRGRDRTVLIVDHANSEGQVFGTKTKRMHVDLSMSLTPFRDDEQDDLDSFDQIRAVPDPKLLLRFDKVRQRVTVADLTELLGDSSVPPEYVENLYEDHILTMGDVSHSWRSEPGRAIQQSKAREMSRNGMTIREIAEELQIPKSTVGRWCKGVKR